jgi:two-component system nitrate/nitrite response regulator NarL
MLATDKHPIKVIIIDDHQLFNDGLFAMLSSEKSLNVIAQVYDSREAERKISELNPDIVLVDFNMPHINGIELTNLLLLKNSDLKILILSMYNDERYIESFKKAKARGYLVKTVSAEVVIEAIHRVADGDFYFPATTPFKNHSEDVFLKNLKLSNRELEVIQLIKEGMKTKEIAEKLNISFYTAETHRKNIRLKIGLKGETEFLKFIYET